MEDQTTAAGKWPSREKLAADGEAASPASSASKLKLTVPATAPGRHANVTVTALSTEASPLNAANQTYCGVALKYGPMSPWIKLLVVFTVANHSGNGEIITCTQE